MKLPHWLTRPLATAIFCTLSLNLMPSVHATTTMPDETALHDSTWLQWPHQYTYGLSYRNRLDATWVAMTRALVQSEKVRIVADSVIRI